MFMLSTLLMFLSKVYFVIICLHASHVYHHLMIIFHNILARNLVGEDKIEAPFSFFVIGIPGWGWGTNLILMISPRGLFSFIFPTMNISKREGCIILSIIFQ